MNKELNKLRAERDMYKARAETYTQLNDINHALIGLLLRQAGADRDKPLRVGMEELKNAIGKLTVMATLDKNEYLMYCAEK